MKKPIQYTRVSPVMKFVYLIIFCALGLSIADAAGPGFLRDLVIKNALSIGKNSAADSKAVLDMVSTTKGFLPPRMTEAQRDAIASPPTGLQVYNTDSNTVNVFNGTAWEEVGSGAGGSSGINILAPYNFNGEDGTASWTESGGGTLASTTTAANVGNGEASISFDASANADYLASTAATIPSGLFGANCLLEFYYKGGDANLTAQVHDGTNVVTSLVLAASTGYRKTQINFTCPQSGTLQMRILASADAAIIYVDEVHMGSASNFGEVNVVTAWETCTLTGSWVSNTTYTCKERRVGDSAEYDVKLALSGAPTSATLTLTLPRTMDTDKLMGIANNGIISATAKFLDTGVKEYFGVVRYASSTTVDLRVYAGDTANPPFGAVVNATSPITWGSGDEITARFSVPVSGWTALPSVALNNSQNWRVDANIAGANFDLGASDQATYISMTNGSMTLTNNTGNGVLTAMIPCSTTNAPSGTTCAAGTEDNGVSFTIPRAGDVRACVSFSHAIANGTTGTVSAAFQIVETPNAAQTISQQGKSRAPSGLTTANTSVVLPGHVCGTFTFTSAGQKTLRLFYEQDVTATVTSNLVLGDASAAHGQRDIHWEVYPIDQNVQAPTLVGSVTSGSANAERIEHAKIISNGASSAVSTESSDWLGTVTHNANGDFTVAINSGKFSATPTCTCTIGYDSNSLNYVCRIHTISATSIRLLTLDSASSAAFAANAFAHLICMGPK